MSKLVEVVKHEGGYVSLLLSSKPVNALSYPFMNELKITIENLEKDSSVKGFIITSNIQKIFSAGLDLRELYKPKKENFIRFWSTFQELIYTICKSKLASVAAINGQCPAGGCILSMACDYRIMMKGFNIGLNETQIGLVAPLWAVDLMKNTIGVRKTDYLCQTGDLISSEEALKCGLVDQVVDSLEELKTKSHEMIKKFVAVPDFARARTKWDVRKGYLLGFDNYKKEEIEMLLASNEQTTKDITPIVMKMFAKSKL